jgi:hypothetical protein
VPFRGARIAITAVFALNGLLFGSVFSRLPAIRDALELSEGRIALALACSMAGLLLAQLVAGAATVRLGSRPVVAAGAVAYALALVPIGLAGSLPVLAVAFGVLGIANGVLDVAMNVQGLHVERRAGRALFGSLHAAFSFGSLAGAGTGALVVAAGVGVAAHLAGAAAGGLVVVALAVPRLLDGDTGGAREPAFARPSRGLAAVGAIAFCALLAEGAINDWSAIFLADEAGASQALAAVGLTVFSGAMGASRLAADGLRVRLGGPALARGGGLLAAAGVALAAATASPAPTMAGLVAAGLGLGALFPLALRAAGSAAEVAAVSTMGYVAFLAGPATVGGGAELIGLRTSILAVAVAALAAAALSPALAGRAGPSSRRRGRRPGRTPA